MGNVEEPTKHPSTHYLDIMLSTLLQGALTLQGRVQLFSRSYTHLLIYTHLVGVSYVPCTILSTENTLGNKTLMLTKLTF